MTFEEYKERLCKEFGYCKIEGYANRDLVYQSTVYGKWVRRIVNIDDPVTGQTGWGLITIEDPRDGTFCDDPAFMEYRGDDIILEYDDKYLVISEGTGENLLPEDEEEGYVDYFNLEVYNKADYDNCNNPFSIGGGFMMREKLIRNEFYSCSVASVIKTVFEANGEEDAFDLYAEGTPQYTLVEC